MNIQKKHIIIAGVPRTGKTLSICKALASTGHYQHIMMDSITHSFEYIFPHLGIFDGKTWDIGFEEVSNKLIKFLADFVKTSKYNDLDYRMLVDMYQLLPKDYIENIGTDYCKVYFVGYPSISIEEKFNNIRKNETKWDWTLKVDDNELKERIKKYIQESKLIQKQCNEYNLPFFDFSYDIDKSTNIIVDYILKDNNYK